MSENVNPAAWGVETSWLDVEDRRHQVPAETLAAILNVLGAEGPPPMAEDGPLVVTAGQRPVVGSGVVETETGGELPIETDGRLPEGLPLGYHRLRLGGSTSRERELIVG